MAIPRKEETLRDYKQRLLRVLDWLEGNLDSSPGLTQLAEVAAFNPFHFHHVFRGLCGLGPMEYLRRRRLERAWQLLHSGTASVANVALDSGYASEEGFIRAFRGQFGITPGEARTQPPRVEDPAELKLRVLNFSFMWGESMEHSIVELDGFQIIGLGIECPGFDGSGIGELWGQFFQRFGELPQTGRIIGASYPRSDGYYYIAGAEVPAGTAVPQGMVAASVPAARYFKVLFHDKAPKMATAFSPIFSEMLPAAGLEPAADPVCLEDYPEDFMDEEAGTMKLDLLVQLAE